MAWHVELKQGRQAYRITLDPTLTPLQILSHHIPSHPMAAGSVAARAVRMGTYLERLKTDMPDSNSGPNGTRTHRDKLRHFQV